MPQIEVDDEIFAMLQSKAVPFVDTPNSVLRRELNLDGVAPDSDLKGEGPALPVQMGAAKPPAPVTPQKNFRPYIRRLLLAHGGGAEMADLLHEVFSAMEADGVLVAGDYDAVSTGEVRWRNAARWERMQMVKEGLLRANTQAGWWELTEKGMAGED